MLPWKAGKKKVERMASRTQSRTDDMTWVEHMEELRRRILKSLLAVGIGMVVAFFFMDPIMAFLTRSPGPCTF